MVAIGPRVPAVSGRLVASGRACDVFEHGAGAILRRYRAGEACDTQREAAVMRRALAAGVRVPEVLEVHPDALVLERVGRAVRRRFVGAYLAGVGARPSAELLRAAADTRLRDPHLRERELASVRELRESL